MVSRTGSGEYLVSGIVGGGEIFVYDAQGVFRGTFGRPGRGPGEFGERLRTIIGESDTIFVSDDRNGRFQVWSPERRFVRSFATPAPVRKFILLSDGSFLFFRVPYERNDHLFFRVDRSGRVTDEFGRVAMEPPDLEWWSVSAARPRGFWGASMWEYEIHKWISPDSLAEVVVREPNWFPGPSDPPAMLDDATPPEPFVYHIHEDDEGRLWTYLRVPDPDWRADIPSEPEVEWLRRTFDTMVEVIDLSSQRVVARSRDDRVIGPVCGSSLMYTVVQQESGHTHMEVFEPRLTTH